MVMVLVPLTLTCWGLYSFDGLFKDDIQMRPEEQAKAGDASW